MGRLSRIHAGMPTHEPSFAFLPAGFPYPTAPFYLTFHKPHTQSLRPLSHLPPMWALLTIGACREACSRHATNMHLLCASYSPCFAACLPPPPTTLPSAPWVDRKVGTCRQGTAGLGQGPDCRRWMVQAGIMALKPPSCHATYACLVCLLSSLCGKRTLGQGPLSLSPRALCVVKSVQGRAWRAPLFPRLCCPRHGRKGRHLAPPHHRLLAAGQAVTSVLAWLNLTGTPSLPMPSSHHA